MADPYEVVATEDKEQFQTKHGSTLQSFNLTAKDKTGAVVLIQMNRKPTSPAPVPGETVWLDTWNTDYGLKGKKMQGPRATPNPLAFVESEGAREARIIRQHSQHMALKWATITLEQQGVGSINPKIDLKTIEAWTDHFDADVQRVSGTAQEVGGAIAGETRPASAPAPSRTPQTGQESTGPPPAPSRAPNGGNPDTITAKQITHFILPRQKMNGLSDDDMRLLVKSFGLERLKDLPKSRVDEFVQAMTNPIPTGESDVPAEFESVASEADDEIPFAFPVLPSFTDSKAHENR